MDAPHWNEYEARKKFGTANRCPKCGTLGAAAILNEDGTFPHDCLPRSDVMRFEKDFKTGEVAGKPMGRLVFPHGIVRIWLLPEGLHAVVPRVVAENDFQIMETDVPFRLAPVPGDEDGQRVP